MIKSFKHKGLEKFYKTGSLQGIQAIHANRLRVILNRLNYMRTLDDVNLPSARLHRLKGNMKDLWSITVQANWRITKQHLMFILLIIKIITKERCKNGNV